MTRRQEDDAGLAPFSCAIARLQPSWAVELSFCVVNTEQRGLLRYCLDAIARERATVDFETEVLVLDNASQDGSVDVARQHPVTTEVIALPAAPRQGGQRQRAAAARDAAASACCSTRTPSSSRARPSPCTPRSTATTRAGAAGAMLVRPDGEQQPSAWRFPSPGTALLTALWLHKRARRAEHAATTSRPGRLGAVGGDARPPLGGRGDRLLRPGVLRLLRRGRLLQAPRATPAGTRSTCPSARAVHHEQLSTGNVPSRRIVEFSRNRDRYMRKHHSPLSAWTRAAADGLDLRRCGRSARSSCPATTRSATPSTSPRRCSRAAARACARAPRSSTGRLGPRRA